MKRNSFTRILRDPLIHFLVLGAALFVLYNWVGRSEMSTIHVDDKVLATWLQYRNKAFAPDVAISRIRAMPEDKKQLLIDDYVTEEVLYRQALALGLDKNDAVIRSRIVQKMEFILLGLNGAEEAPSRVEVREFFNEHQEQYRIPANVTLSHLFFSSGNSVADRSSAESRAAAALTALQRGDVVAGERFMFQKNYVDAKYALLKDHLGEVIAKQVFSQNTPIGEWFGPLESPYGWHLIYLLRREASRIPEFFEVAEQVAADLQQEKMRERRARVAEKLREQYRVEIAP